MSEGLSRRAFVGGLAALVAGCATNPLEDSRIYEAHDLMSRRDYSNARDLIDEVIQETPNPPAMLYNGRGICSMGKGELFQATIDFGIATEIDPNFEDAFYNRGLSKFSRANIQYKAGEKFEAGFLWHSAGKDFERAIKLDDQKPESFAHLGMCQYLICSDQDSAKYGAYFNLAYDNLSKATRLINKGIKMKRMDQRFTPLTEDQFDLVYRRLMAYLKTV